MYTYSSDTPYGQRFQPTDPTLGTPNVFEILQQQQLMIYQLREDLANMKIQMQQDQNSIRPQAPMAYIRVIHAVLDAPNVDVWVDGKKTVSNLSYRSVTRYLPVPAGEHHIKVVPHNRTTPVFINAAVRLNTGIAYSVLTIGTVHMIRPMVTIDKMRTVVGDFANISIIHASPNAGAVDIVLPDGRKVASNLMFGQVTSSLEVPAGPFSATVRIAGTNQTILTVPVLMIRAGVSYTVVVVGSSEGTPNLEVLVTPNLL